MSAVYTLDPNYTELRAFIEDITNRFNDDANTIHQARNVLKVFDVNAQRIVVKSFKVPNIINQIAYGFFRNSKAARSYLYSQKLITLGIATPRPIAFAEYKTCGLLKQSYYVCEYLENSFEIRTVLRDAHFANRRQILKAFAAFSYRLHEAGVYHVDYSPGNVLITEEAGHYDFSIVDVNRMEFIDFDDELRMKNLSRFSATEEDTQMIAAFYAEIAGLNTDWAVARLHFYHGKHQEYLQQKKRLKKLRQQR